MRTKKITAIVMAALMSVSLFAGCGKSDSKEEITTESITEEVTAMTEDLSALDPHAAMLRRSFYSMGNTYRLLNKFSQMRSGTETTVAFIGGSITEGYTVNPDECYAKLTYDMLCETYPDTKLNYVNAGISGTPSILGNLRVQRDVLDYNADIVFIEFAVNDGGEQIFQESYDSLVHTILEQENEPAVILLFNRTKEGHTSQEYMKQIGEYYDLGMISTADALTPALDDGSIVWEDYYNDSSHPNPNGHKLFKEFIENYFFMLATQSTLPEGYTLNPLGKLNAPYKNAVMIEADYDNSNETVQISDIGAFDKSASLSGFNNGWKFNPDSDSGSFKMTVTGNSLFLICHRNNNASMGKIEVYIDGTRAKVIDTNDKDGWGDPYAYQVIKWQTVKTMEIEIKVPEDSLDKTVEILGIACTANQPI